MDAGEDREVGRYEVRGAGVLRVRGCILILKLSIALYEEIGV